MCIVHFGHTYKGWLFFLSAGRINVVVYTGMYIICIIFLVEKNGVLIVRYMYDSIAPANLLKPHNRIK